MKRVERWEEKRYVGNLKGTRVLGDQNFFVIYATSKDNRENEITPDSLRQRAGVKLGVITRRKGRSLHGAHMALTEPEAPFPLLSILM